MEKRFFLNLTKLQQCNELLKISNESLLVLQCNKKIYKIASLALKKTIQFLNDNHSLSASELSIYLNNPNEDEDLGLLFYEAANEQEELALDIITLTVGFAAKIAHEIQKSNDKMPQPVIEANAEIVYEAFSIFEKLSTNLNNASLE